MPAGPPTDDLPVKPFKTKAAFAAWLEKSHGSAPGVWIKYAKKSSGLKSITFEEALDVVLSYGWIDGQGRGLDETHYLQRYTPRRSRSLWSKRNREKVLALIESGEMKPAGIAEVERAKADGRWDVAYDAPSTATVPPELAAALKRNKKAKAFFEALDSRNRYAILHRIQTAKKPETKARRIAKFVEMLARGEKIYP